MTYTLFVAVELSSGYKKSKLPQKYFTVRNDGQAPIVVSKKLFGASVNQSALVKRVWYSPEFLPDGSIPGWKNELVEKIFAYRVRGGAVILLLQFKFETDNPGKLAQYKRLSSVQLRNVLDTIEANNFLIGNTTVYPVIGSIAPEGDDWKPLTKDGWLHIQGSYQHEKVLGEIVAQVAIERYFLTWATSPIRGIKGLFHTPIASAVIRKWPVQFLSDWEEITRNYLRLRESLNLPNVRTEVLERGKSWWNLFTAGLGGFAFVATISTLFLAL